MAEPTVLVVGAGPAGSALSWFLARSGLEVRLVDQARWPRDKTCGDCLSPRSLAVLRRMGLLEQVSAQGRQIRRAALVAPGGRRITTRIPVCYDGLDHLVVLPRLQFDDLVRRQAVAAGADFREQVRVRSFIEDQGRVVGVHAETPAGPVEMQASVVALATGSNLALAGQAGMVGRRPPIGLAARAYFENITDLGDDIEMHFDGGRLSGYTWIFPTGASTANVGVGYFPRPRGQRPPIRPLFERALATPRLAGRLRGASQVGPLRSLPMHFGFDACRLARPGLVLVGEAAGLVNPLSGEGIDLALESAELAADNLVSLIGAGVAPERLAETHRRVLRERFLGEMRAVAKVREMYLRGWILDRLAAVAERRRDLRRMLVEIALGIIDPGTAIRPRVLARLLLG